MHTPPKKRTIFLVIIIILILSALFGWLLWKDTGKSGSGSAGGPSVASGDTECPSDTIYYSNTDLGIAFCYPNAWGTVNVSDAKFAPADGGQRYRITFTAKPQVHAGMATADWSTAAARDGICSDPAVPSIPDRGAYVTDWQVDTEIAGQPSSAYRGIGRDEGQYVIYETVSDVLESGVCIEGYRIVSLSNYNNVSASYSVPFNGTVTTPQQHIDSPESLISAADRNDFSAFVRSIRQL